MSSANLELFFLKPMLLVLSSFVQNFVIIGQLSFFDTSAPHFGSFVPHFATSGSATLGTNELIQKSFLFEASSSCI